MANSQLGRLERRIDGWWIVGMCCGDMGPYETQDLARDDWRGVQRFYKETSREKQKPLFSGLKCASGQMNLFETDGVQ